MYLQVKAEGCANIKVGKSLIFKLRPMTAFITVVIGIIELRGRELTGLQAALGRLRGVPA